MKKRGGLQDCSAKLAGGPRLRGHSEGAETIEKVTQLEKTESDWVPTTSRLAGQGRGDERDV